MGLSVHVYHINYSWVTSGVILTFNNCIIFVLDPRYPADSWWLRAERVYWREKKKRRKNRGNCEVKDFCKVLLNEKRGEKKSQLKKDPHIFLKRLRPSQPIEGSNSPFIIFIGRFSVWIMLYPYPIRRADGSNTFRIRMHNLSLFTNMRWVSAWRHNLELNPTMW